MSGAVIYVGHSLVTTLEAARRSGPHVYVRVQWRAGTFSHGGSRNSTSIPPAAVQRERPRTHRNL